ncbi:hypothetical protein [Streptomyces sp. NPDC002187]|uniref:hypothetical protein n=1 Tax=Streptomyces sp. NPDC002187 TaxID=3364637 RepID=UPI0036B1B30D
MTLVAPVGSGYSRSSGQALGLATWARPWLPTWQALAVNSSFSGGRGDTDDDARDGWSRRAAVTHTV